jgi:hypothetical protein
MDRWKSVNKTIPNDRGVASIWYCGKKVLRTVLLSWPENLLNGEKTRNGNYFGTKSGTLEAIDLFLPFITFPRELKNKYIVLQVDNTSLGYGWEKHYCKIDPETSLLLRTLHVIENLLECKIFVQHVKRCSSTIAKLADDLSRKATTSAATLRKINEGQIHYAEGSLVDWLKIPVLDWSLPEKIVKDVKKLLQ